MLGFFLAEISFVTSELRYVHVSCRNLNLLFKKKATTAHTVYIKNVKLKVLKGESSKQTQ